MKRQILSPIYPESETSETENSNSNSFSDLGSAQLLEPNANESILHISWQESIPEESEGDTGINPAQEEQQKEQADVQPFAADFSGPITQLIPKNPRPPEMSSQEIASQLFNESPVWEGRKLCHDQEGEDLMQHNKLSKAASSDDDEALIQLCKVFEESDRREKEELKEHQALCAVAVEFERSLVSKPVASVKPNNKSPVKEFSHTGIFEECKVKEKEEPLPEPLPGKEANPVEEPLSKVESQPENIGNPELAVKQVDGQEPQWYGLNEPRRAGGQDFLTVSPPKKKKLLTEAKLEDNWCPPKMRKPKVAEELKKWKKELTESFNKD